MCRPRKDVCVLFEKDGNDDDDDDYYFLVVG